MQGKAAVVVCVDELVGGRRRLGQNAKPGEGIAALVDAWTPTLTLPRTRGRERCPRDAVRAVATGHELAREGCVFAVATVGDARVVILDTLDRRRLGLEPDLATVHQALRDQVLDHFLLAVDRDPLAGQAAEIDAVLLPGEAQLDAVVREAFADHALAHAGRGEQIGRSLFQDAGSHPALDVVSATPFEDD